MKMKAAVVLLAISRHAQHSDASPGSCHLGITMPGYLPDGHWLLAFFIYIYKKDKKGEEYDIKMALWVMHHKRVM